MPFEIFQISILKKDLHRDSDLSPGSEEAKRASSNKAIETEAEDECLCFTPELLILLTLMKKTILLTYLVGTEREDGRSMTSLRTCCYTEFHSGGLFGYCSILPEAAAQSSAMMTVLCKAANSHSAEALLCPFLCLAVSRERYEKQTQHEKNKMTYSKMEEKLGTGNVESEI
ncbi:hypothetical protein STEG23_024083 [Scotinomys teguina]